jgi:ABC-type multidrug transport system fused ATPase/permease subunit
MPTTSPFTTPPILSINPIFDYTSQQSYLNEVAALQKEQNDEIAELQRAQTTFDNINKAFENTSNTNAGILTDQDKVIDLVNQEYYRLYQKKKYVDDAVYGQERAALLNDSYRLKYIEYTKMLIAFVIVLVIIIALYQFKTVFPPFVIDLSVFVLCTLLLFYCYFVYTNLAARDPLNFNEINLIPPARLSPHQANLNKASGSAQNITNLFSNELNGLGECLGPACCADGTYFDPTSTQCLPGTAPPTTASPTTSAPTGQCSASGSSGSGDVAPGIYNGGTAVYYTN